MLGNVTLNMCAQQSYRSACAKFLLADNADSDQAFRMRFESSLGANASRYAFHVWLISSGGAILIRFIY